MTRRRVVIATIVVVLLPEIAVAVDLLAGRWRGDAIFATYHALSEANARPEPVTLRPRPDSVVVNGEGVFLVFRPSPFQWINYFDKSMADYDTYGIVMTPACGNRKASVKISHGSGQALTLGLERDGLQPRNAHFELAGAGSHPPTGFGTTQSCYGT